MKSETLTSQFRLASYCFDPFNRNTNASKVLLSISGNKLHGMTNLYFTLRLHDSCQIGRKTYEEKADIFYGTAVKCFSILALQAF